MRARDLDLSTLWQDVTYHYELLGRRPPWYLRLAWRAMHHLLVWAATRPLPARRRGAV